MTKRRVGEHSNMIDSVLEDGKNMEFAEHVIPAEDREEIKKSVEQSKAVRNKAVEGRGASSSGGAAASSSTGDGAGAGSTTEPGVRTKALPRALGNDAPTLEWAMALLPPVRKCTVTTDDNWHMRWKIGYPTDAPPRSHSKTWNAERSCLDALKECLVWAWNAHFEATGQSCPFCIASLPLVVPA